MEELSILDIVAIIWAKKWVIAIVTGICIILGLVYVLFIMGDSYESEAVLMVSPLQDSNKVENIDSISGIVEYLSENPTNSIESYIEQIKLAPVLDVVADKLGIDKTSEFYLESLRKRVDVSSSTDSNLVYIRFKDEYGSNAIRGANLIADTFISFVSDNLKAQANLAIDFIEEQYELENSNVEKSLNELAEFLAQSRGVDELQGELSNNVNKINKYKDESRDIEISIAYNKAGLAAVKDRLEATPIFITTVKVVGNEEMLSAVLMDEPGTNFSDIADLSMVEQIPNESYILLIDKLNEFEILIRMDEEKLKGYESSLVVMQSEIEVIQAELALKQTESEVLNENVSIAKASRDLYQDELKTVETKLVADIGKKSVVKIADAIDYKVVGTSKANIMIIVAIFGIVIGVFAVFILNSLKSDAKPIDDNSTG